MSWSWGGGNFPNFQLIFSFFVKFFSFLGAAGLGLGVGPGGKNSLFLFFLVPKPEAQDQASRQDFFCLFFFHERLKSTGGEAPR